MTLFPIVERELRLASRRALTFWLRVIAAGVSVIIAAGLLAIFLNIPGGGGFQPGAPLFAVLTWMALAVTLAAGVFFTSDCLSEEKREGTLGFLFLTDLRGYDVVFGKMIGTLCRCVFALMAIFPVLACTLLFGGVEAGEFWRTILALLHALFFSLAAGMFVSSISHHPQKALAGTIVLICILCGGGAAIDGFLAWANSSGFKPTLSLASPVIVFLNAESWSPAFQRSLAVSEITAWLMLGGACVLIPRTWQEKGRRARSETSSFKRWWRFGSERRRARLRGATMDNNPTTWLVCRERAQSFFVWAMAIFVVSWFVLTKWLDDSSIFGVMGWRMVNMVTVLVLYLWVTSQASQFFADARRGGLIELMLGTPLDFRKVAPGAWRGLLRMFGLPVVIVLGIGFVSQVAKLDGTGWMSANSTDRSIPQWVIVLGTATCSLLYMLANLVALAWFGMWMGLTSRNGLMGTLKTIVFVQIGPWLVITFAGGMLFPMIAFLSTRGKSSWLGSNWMQWYPIVSTLLMTVLTLGKDVAFYLVARQKMVDQFREVAVRAVAPVQRHRRVVETVKPKPPIAKPPVMGSRAG